MNTRQGWVALWVYRGWGTTAVEWDAAHCSVLPRSRRGPGGRGRSHLPLLWSILVLCDGQIQEPLVTHDWHWWYTICPDSLESLIVHLIKEHHVRGSGVLIIDVIDPVRVTVIYPGWGYTIVNEVIDDGLQIHIGGSII